MWFRQLSLFRLPTSMMPSFDELEAALHKKPFHPCSGLDWFTQGFAPVAAHAPDLMLHTEGGCALLALKREDKVLPAAVIREFTELKAAEIEDKEARKIGKKEKKELKEQITDDLLPRAFTRTGRTLAYLDRDAGWLVVDSGTASKAEGLASAIREALPPFPARLPQTAMSPAAAMTSWLLDGAPAGFELDADCELKSPGDDGAVVRCSRQDLTATEVRQHVESGKVAVKLGLIWQERIRFVLTEQMQLKKLQFLDLLQDEASQAGDDAEALFAATFLLMSGELRHLITDLVAALGGEQPDAAAASAATPTAPSATPADTSTAPWL